MKKAQIWTYIVGGIVSLTTIVIGAIRQGNVPLVMATTIPILAMIVADRIAMYLKSSSDREETIKKVLEVLPQAALIRSFRNSSEAMTYLSDNVSRCKRVINTRLLSRKVEKADFRNARVTDQFDANVKKAILSGMDYFWLVSPEFRAEAEAMTTVRNQQANRGRHVGVCTCYQIDNQHMPFLHFIILDYGDSAELLIGWAVEGPADYSEAVFLISDRRLVSYFEKVFRIYANQAEVIAMP